jgi:hypothetical protein
VLIKRSTIFRKLLRQVSFLWCFYLFYTSFVIASISACVGLGCYCMCRRVVLHNANSIKYLY